MHSCHFVQKLKVTVPKTIKQQYSNAFFRAFPSVAGKIVNQHIRANAPGNTALGFLAAVDQMKISTIYFLKHFRQVIVHPLLGPVMYLDRPAGNDVELVAGLF